jgi:hypothetical protein
MIPLMMTDGYSPKGWRKSEHHVLHRVFPIAMLLTCKHVVLVVGLILGTRLWYPMWDAEKDDDAAFEQRMDPVRNSV